MSAGDLARRARRLGRAAVRRAGAAPAPPPAAPAAAPTGRDRPAPRVAILLVNGFDRRGRWGDFNVAEAREFPWVRLCLEQVERHSRSASYEVLAWDNSWLPAQRKLMRQHPRVRLFSKAERGEQLNHGTSLDRLVAKVHPGTEYVITLDTDSFPVRDGWIENLTGRLSDDVWLAGVWRDELLPQSPAFIHPCCTAIRADRLRELRERGVGFKIKDGTDVGARLTTATVDAGARVSRLHRSNRWDPHRIMGAVYGDLVYHQGAGSRNPQFRGDAARDADGAEGVRLALRDAAFSDLDALVAALTGDREPQEAVPAVHAAVQEAHRLRPDTAPADQ